MTSMIHRFPFSGINFTLFEVFKHKLYPSYGENFFTRFLSAGSAAGISVCACYPLDVVRTRLVAQMSYNTVKYTGILQALRTIVAEEGFRGLYRGLGTTLLVAVPNVAICFSTFSGAKQFLLQNNYFVTLEESSGVEKGTNKYTKEEEAWRKETKEGQGGGCANQQQQQQQVSSSLLTSSKNILSKKETDSFRLSGTGALLAGAISGILASSIMFPVDVIKRRMQMMGIAKHHVEELAKEGRSTPWGEATYLMRHEGIKGFYRGLSAELMKIIPTVAVTFWTYEFLKRFLKVS